MNVASLLMRKRRQIRGLISSSETSTSMYFPILFLACRFVLIMYDSKSSFHGNSHVASRCRKRIPTKASPDSTGHLFVLLIFLLFSLILRAKLGPFLVFLLAFVFFSFVAHIRFSSLEPNLPNSAYSATSPSFLGVIVPPRRRTLNRS